MKSHDENRTRSDWSDQIDMVVVIDALASQTSVVKLTFDI